MIERPHAALVLGILNILFGSMALVSAPFTLLTLYVPLFAQGNPVIDMMNRSPVLRVWTHISLGLGMAAGALLVIAGIGLIKMKPWGRRFSIGYGFYTIFMSLVGLFFHVTFLVIPLWEESRRSSNIVTVFGAIGGALGGTAGICLAFVYAVVLILVLRRPQIVQAFERSAAGY